MKRAVYLASTAMAGMISCHAWAQTASTPTTTVDPQAPVVVGEVIVTAQKRSESLTTAPIAVSVFTPESRQRIGIETLSDYANFTPGMNYSPGSDRVFLRGIGRQTNIIGSDAGVATYSDGVYSASTTAAAGDELFVQRTEILRGPQGALYGRNSIGGAINTISRRPTDTVYAEGRATIGDYDLYGVEAAVSGPVSKAVRLRIAGLKTEQDSGYWNNLATGQSEGGRGRTYYVEGQAEVDFTPKLDGWLKIFTGGNTSFPHPTNLIDPYDVSRFPPGALTPGAAFGLTTAGVVQAGSGTTNPGVSDSRTFSADTKSRSRTYDNYGVSGQLHFAGDGFQVRYIGGYQEYKFESVADLDQTAVTSYSFPLNPFPLAICYFVPGCGPLKVSPTQTFSFAEQKKFFSHELNISSSGDGPLQWIIGGYFYDEEASQTSRFAASNQPQLVTPANGPANPTGAFVYAAGAIDTRSYAGFGQLDWAVTPTLSLTGGLRYTRDEKSGVERFRELCFGLPACGFDPASYGSLTPGLDITGAVISQTAAPGVVAAPSIDAATGVASRKLSDNWDGVTGTAGVRWTPDADTMAYLRYGRGYKSGGFNTGALIALPETNPEHVDSYEIGAKRKVNGQFSVNAAAFYYSYTDLQVPLTITPAGVQITSFANIPEARSYGAELETLWSPIHNLQLLFNYSYLNAKVEKSSAFVDLASPAPISSAKGQDLPDSPRNKVAFNSSYTLDFGPGSLTLSGSYIWRDDSYGYVFNRDYTKPPAYSQVDLRALWTDRRNHYTIIAYLRNAFDENGYYSPLTVTGTPPVGPTARQVNLTPPRTFGVQLQYRF